METSDDIRIEVRSDPCLLKAVRELVRGHLDTCGFAAERRDEIVLAVDEACTNAIRHSYGGRNDRVLELIVRGTARYVEIVLCDEGIPVPAGCLERAGAEKPAAEPLRPGGLGIQLIHRVFDEVTYRPGKEQGNCVTMRAFRPDMTRAQCP